MGLDSTGIKSPTGASRVVAPVGADGRAAAQRARGIGGGKALAGGEVHELDDAADRTSEHYKINEQAAPKTLYESVI